MFPFPGEDSRSQRDWESRDTLSPPTSRGGELYLHSSLFLKLKKNSEQLYLKNKCIFIIHEIFIICMVKVVEQGGHKADTGDGMNVNHVDSDTALAACCSLPASTV